MKMQNEDHLLVIIESFYDFNDITLLLGYDLRIDAYSYCYVPPQQKKIDFHYGSIYLIQKIIQTTSGEHPKPSLPYLFNSPSTIGSAFDSEQEISFSCKIHKIRSEQLNTIEKIYYTHFRQKHELRVVNEVVSLNPLQILIGSVIEVKEVFSSLGNFLDLLVQTDSVSESLWVRTQDLTYHPHDHVCFLLKTIPSSQGVVHRVLGMKTKNEVPNYLNKDYRGQRVKEINLIELK